MASVLSHRSIHSQALPFREAELTVPDGMGRELFHAMGTTISVLLPEQQSRMGAEIVRALFEQWESTLSRFRPESELSQLNKHAGEPFTVSELLYSVLMTALAAARATHGLYDPTIQRQLVLLGYDRSFERLPLALPGLEYPSLTGGGWQRLRINHRSRCITLPPGVGLDFGGIAKGMAVDAALTSLQEAGVKSALVNAGGDLAVLGEPVGAKDWTIAVQGKERAWSIPLSHGAMATSGIARRRWQQGQEMRHHLLDPRTGLPAQQGLWSVTVVAARCEQAEVAAKVAYILGRDEGKTFLRKHGLAGLFVAEDGTWEAVGPWPVSHMEE